jgi:mRNA-degrading endonuclease toxin of MazEF toxin-antitoxin module
VSDRYEQGAVVVGEDPFGGGTKRPYLVVSNDTRPFGDEEDVAVVVTTTERDRAIPLAGEYVEGELPYESFVSPWSPVTLKHAAIDKRVAHVSRAVLDDVADALYSYVTPTENA